MDRRRFMRGLLAAAGVAALPVGILSGMKHERLLRHQWLFEDGGEETWWFSGWFGGNDESTFEDLGNPHDYREQMDLGK